MEEFTLVKGKKYQATIHLPGFEDYASNQQIIDMLAGYGFTEIDVTGHGRTRKGSALWNGETVTGPLDRHIVEICEVVVPPPTPAIDPVMVPDAPPVFEKPEKKIVKTSHQEQEDDEE